MNRKNWLCFTMVVFMVLPLLWVRNSYAVESLKGRGSIGAALSYQSAVFTVGSYESETNTTSLQGSIGYFVTDHLEVNFAPVMSASESEAGSSSSESTSYSYFGNLKYNFYQRGSTTVPFVGLQAGITGYESDGDTDSAFSYGGMVGVKFFLTEDISLNLELNYLQTTFEAQYPATQDTEYEVSSFFAGFSYYFGGE